MPVRPLSEVFTARAIGVSFDRYQQTLGSAPFLGRSLFMTDKKMGLDLRFIKGRKGLPVALKGASFDAKAPLRDAIGFKDFQNEMPFFRESYMVSEKEEQEYMTYMNAENAGMANQVLKEIMKNPMDLVLGADVIPERMIWQLLAPHEGTPSIDIDMDGGSAYMIDYLGDYSTNFETNNMISITGTSKWSVPATATPIADLVKAQDQYEETYGGKLDTFVMNKKTWKRFMAAEDTKLQVLGAIASQAGVMLKEADVKSYLVANYGITVIVYNKMYISDTGITKTFIPDGIVTGIAGTAPLGTVWYGTTPEERSGSLANGSLSIVNTGVSIYTYTTNHPVNTHCVVSEIVLPSFEGMDRVFVINTEGE